jgi:hypothetical protein
VDGTSIEISSEIRAPGTTTRESGAVAARQARGSIHFQGRTISSDMNQLVFIISSFIISFVFWPSGDELQRLALARRSTFLINRGNDNTMIQNIDKARITGKHHRTSLASTV